MHQLLAAKSSVIWVEAVGIISFIVPLSQLSRLSFGKGGLRLGDFMCLTALGTTILLRVGVKIVACHSQLQAGHFHSALKLLPAKTCSGGFSFCCGSRIWPHQVLRSCASRAACYSSMGTVCLSVFGCPLLLSRCVATQLGTCRTATQPRCYCVASIPGACSCQHPIVVAVLG